MFEVIVSLIPVEMRPMSIISLMFFIMLLYIIRLNMKSIKLLEEDLEKTKCALDKAKDHLNDQIKDIVLDLKVDVTDLKASLRSMSSCLTNMKVDIRDLRIRKSE